MSVSIVIPHYNHWEFTHALLADLFKHEVDNINEVILVDNGGTDEEIFRGEKFWKQQFQIKDCNFRILTLRENVGFLLAANLGLQEARSTVKILISNDVRVKGKFVEQVRDLILSGYTRKLVGQKLYVTDTGWNTFDNQVYPYLEGFFLATMTDGWDELGYFDVDFIPADYEDVALSTKARKLGYELVPLNLPFIDHVGAGTYGYNAERLRITEANREKFRQKYHESMSDLP